MSQQVQTPQKGSSSIKAKAETSSLKAKASDSVSIGKEVENSCVIEESAVDKKMFDPANEKSNTPASSTSAQS